MNTSTSVTPDSHPVTFRTFEKECSIYGVAQALRNIESFAVDYANTLGYDGDVSAVVSQVKAALGGYKKAYMNKIYETIIDRLVDAKYPLTAAGIAKMEAVTK